MLYTYRDTYSNIQIFLAWMKNKACLGKENKMSFLDDVKDVLNDTKQRTENGAVGYSTSKHELLDMNFAVPSYRKKSEVQIKEDFTKAYFENPLLAVAWIFYVRDVRGGLGERRLFRVCMKQIAETNTQLAIELLPLIAEYGRFDDIFELLNIDSTFDIAIAKVVAEQFKADFDNMSAGKPISLLAKWLPTQNCSNAVRKQRANFIVSKLGLTPKDYRQTVSAMRKYLDVVETKISKNKWSEIDYNTVPSGANLKYNGAFLKHDEDRRRAYLAALIRGDKDVKINSSTLYPHDIVTKYMNCNYWRSDILNPYDETLEQLWKNLPNMIKDGSDTLVVADGSYSMTCSVGNGATTALNVANALAIYFSEHNKGEFANKYITFSSRPQLVDFSKAKSLRDKLQIALAHNECADTNIEATFDLILNTAVKNNYSQSDIPSNIVIISDMEFNMATYGRTDKALFETISDKFEANGYKMPRLVFWNVNSRTNTIPIQQNDMGVILISGFSVNLCNMVLNGETDPYVALVKEITKERYAPILEIAHEVLDK